MKKAVIKLGSSQYVVSEGDVLNVSIPTTKEKTLKVVPLMIIEEKSVTVGTPEVEAGSVVLAIEEQEIKAEKVTAIRYKAKKRVLKTRGHRQIQTRLKVSKIA